MTELDMDQMFNCSWAFICKSLFFDGSDVQTSVWVNLNDLLKVQTFSYTEKVKQG